MNLDKKQEQKILLDIAKGIELKKDYLKEIEKGPNTYVSDSYLRNLRQLVESSIRSDEVVLNLFKRIRKIG